EFQTRANQLQLATWNSIDFGYTAPTADQFLRNERQLASLGMPRAPGAPKPIRVASGAGVEPEYPRLVSPLTGEPVDEALLEPEAHGTLASARLGPTRIPLAAAIGSAAP